MSTSEPRDQVRRTGLDLARYAGLGLQFTLTLALFGALGWWLDSWWSTSPWLLVAGVLAGGVVAFLLVLRAVPPPSHPAVPPALQGPDVGPTRPPKPPSP